MKSYIELCLQVYGGLHSKFSLVREKERESIAVCGVHSLTQHTY